MIYALRSLCFSVTVAAVLLLGGCGETSSSPTYDDDPFDGKRPSSLDFVDDRPTPPPPPKNNSPVIEDISGPAEIRTGKDARFKAIVHDPDGDQLTYEWFLEIDGELFLIGPGTATWVVKLPADAPGRNAELTLTVSDGKRGGAQKSTGPIPIKRPPPPQTMTKQFTVQGAQVALWERNFWEDWEKTLTFPGKIIDWSWRSQLESGDGSVEKGAEVLSGNKFTLKGQILAKTWPISVLHVWVTATYLPPE